MWVETPKSSWHTWSKVSLAITTKLMPDPGLLPGFKTIFSGDISSKRKMTAAMLEGFYQSCFEPDPVSDRPFAASAIISNPPAFAHIHVAEALGLPLLMSFSEHSFKQLSDTSDAVVAHWSLRTSTRQCQEDQRRQGSDKLPQLCNGRDIDVARTGRHYQRLQSVTAPQGFVVADRAYGDGTTERPVHLCLERVPVAQA